MLCMPDSITDIRKNFPNPEVDYRELRIRGKAYQDTPNSNKFAIAFRMATA